MAATTKQTAARHDTRLCSLTGVIFALISTATALFLQGFVTSSWSVEKSTHQGLWHTCERKDQSSSEEWFKAVQVFACLSLVAFVISYLLVTFYMFCSRHVFSKNFNLVLLVAFCFITAIFMLITVAVYGAYSLADKKTSWSYWVMVASAVLCFIAAILGVVQIRGSNVLTCIGTPQD